MMITTPPINDSMPVISLALECRAPRKKVFETWTEPEWLKKWFKADENFQCTVAEVDLSVGGRYKLGMALPGNEPTVFSGVYQVVRPNDALVYTWEGGEGEHITLVTAIFSDRGTGSRVDFTHGVFLNQESRDLHSQGWMGCLESLRKILGE